MSLRFDGLFSYNKGDFDVSKLSLREEVSGNEKNWVVRYSEEGDFPGRILAQGDELRELLKHFTYGEQLPDRFKHLDKVVKDHRFKFLSRNYSQFESGVKRNKLLASFKRAVELAKKIGKGLFKIGKEGFSGRIVVADDWEKEVVNQESRFISLTKNERQKYIVDFVNGRLQRGDTPYSTKNEQSAHSGNGYAIFVIGPDKKMYCHSHTVFVFHHLCRLLEHL